MKPDFYIETKYEKNVINSKGLVVEHYFPQPVEYCNGKTYFQYPENSYERKSWAENYWKSYRFDEAITASNFNSNKWRSEEAKNKAFEIIYQFCLNGKSGNFSSITPLMPFEIELMNNGYQMIGFCELNALSPSFSIVAEKVVEDKIINPSGFIYRRAYRKESKIIGIGFGKKTNFYFQIMGNIKRFQVPIDMELFDKAVNGELKPIEP
jgi:hypothetical protein